MKIVTHDSPRFKSLFNRLLNRFELGEDAVEKSVRKILDDVRKSGDPAVRKFTKKFDRLDLGKKDFRVTGARIRNAYSEVKSEVVESLKFAAERIRSFHRRQKQESWRYREGEITLGQLIRPMERAGLYVPGGKAAYPSSLLMNAIPAQVAGVKEIVVCSPAPGGELNPAILVAADILGISEIYPIGGAQAIGAMAYGTKNIRKVDKIVGPGNIFVATAKRLVYGWVDIDMIAGPSEVLVLADETADPALVASDLLAQAEHDEKAHPVCMTPSRGLAEKILQEVGKQLKTLDRRKIAGASIRKNGLIFVTDSIDQAIEMANQMAPEHLELEVRDPESYLDRIHHAGAVFLGHYTPEAVGDYLAGPNHVLPTGGTARFFSPLCVEDFLKKTSLIWYTREALARVSDHVIHLARAEGLTGHARSLEIRKK